MYRPRFCLICFDPLVEPTLEKYEVTPKAEGQSQQVQALVAYSCVKGHVFFVRKADLLENDPGASPKEPEFKPLSCVSESFLISSMLCRPTSAIAEYR